MSNIQKKQIHRSGQSEPLPMSRKVAGSFKEYSKRASEFLRKRGAMHSMRPRVNGRKHV